MFFSSTTFPIPSPYSERDRFAFLACGLIWLGWPAWLAAGGLWDAVFGFAALAGLLVFSKGDTGNLLFGWLALTPLLSFFARWPREQSIVSFDRVVVACLVLFFLRDAVNRRIPGGRRTGLFEPVQLVFCILVLLDLALRPGSSLYAWKTGVDGFPLPLAVFVVARQGIDIKRLGKAPVRALSALAVFLFAVGAYEFAFQTDAMAYPGSDVFRDGMVRANGPFAANHSYGLVALIAAVLLWHWPLLAPAAESRAERLVRRGAALVAVAACFIPLFRAFWLTAGICLALPVFLLGDARRRRRVAVAGLLAVAFLVAGSRLIASTSFYQSRVANPENIHTRVATYEAALVMFENNPLTGVGLTRYTTEYRRVYYNEDDYNRKYPTFGGEIPRDSPHNNVLSVLAELGIVAGFVYVAANALLLLEGVLLYRRGNARARGAGALLIAVWAAYWIPGMVLASGYYADLNFYFLAACGLILGAGRKNEACP